MKKQGWMIIIDSISHEWDGNGGILDIQGNMVGNSFTNWSKLTPRHNAFIQKMLQTNAHIIATLRTKQDYVLNEKNGKMVPEKVGLKSVSKDGVDYEFTIVFDLDIKHMAVSSKDRTGLFADKPQFVINASTGRKIINWCSADDTKEIIVRNIKNASNIEDLRRIYLSYPLYQKELEELFIVRSKELQMNEPV